MKRAFFVATLAFGSLIAREASATAFQILNTEPATAFADYMLLGQAGTGGAAGQLDFGSSPAVPTGYSAAFYAYCVDAQASLVSPESVTISSTNLITTTRTPAFVTNAGGKRVYLINSWAPIVNALTGSTQDTDAAALQVATWEALYDNDDAQATVSTNLRNGDFILNSADPGVISQALAYLTELYSGPAGAAKMSQATWLDVGVAGIGQSLIMAAPEPASVLLLGTGLFAMGHGIRRRRPFTRARVLGRTAPADAEAEAEAATPKRNAQ